MDEKKMLDKIRQSAEKLDSPDSLNPEEIRNQLKWIQPEGKKYGKVFRIGGLAAALLLTLAAVWQVGRNGMLTPNESQNQTGLSSPLSETEAGMEATSPETDTGLKSTSPETEALPAAVEGIRQLDGYDQIYEELKHSFITGDGTETGGTYGMPEMKAETEAAQERAVEDSASKESSSSGQNPDYSQTNIQELGVDEGDTVRTDGTWIYIMNTSGQLRIIHADGGNLELTGTLTIPELSEVTEEMYLDGNTLNLITSGSSSQMQEDSDDVYRLDSKTYIRLYTYDISDRANPKLTGTVTQEGSYRTSRKVGSYIYLFSEYFPILKEARDASTFIPEINGKRLPADDILLPEVMTDSAYLVISSVDSSHPEDILDRKAIVSAASMFYVSTENIYICNNNWNGSGNTTQILKFGYRDGAITPAGVGEVNGYINDSFSLNEYNGNLRVLTTDWTGETSLNHLFVLDEGMQICGKLSDLAPDETIRSARFMGNTAYFVTFRETDPLFSVDLSKPKEPKLLGSLKVTGFSSYLHFYGENKLLGLGNEVDPETGEYLGVKLSMFDLSDPANVTELHKYVIKEAYDCPALYDYKTILVNPEKNILGFECENSYLLFRYDPQQGFTNVFTESLRSEDAYREYGYNARGLYIGDIFYLTDTSFVAAYDMTNEFTEIGRLRF